MVCTTSEKQISRTFQGFFKDKLQFLRTKIYLINWHSLTPFDYPIGYNMSWSNLQFLLRPLLITLFYTTFHNKTLQNDWDDLQFIASEVA